MIKQLTILCLILFISGCAQKPQPVPEDFDYRQQLTRLEKLQHWEIKGRISITTTEDAFSASFKWSRLVDYQRIDITGMLGQTYVTLEITPDKAMLSVDDREPVIATDLDQLMWSQLGFTLPIELLTDWVKAYPTTSTLDSVRINVDGFIQSMSFQEWQVDYKRYRDFPGLTGLQLPSRTTVTNNRETIKLAIKTWNPL